MEIGAAGPTRVADSKRIRLISGWILLLVVIPVHVTTPLGATVTNLARENFQLFEEDAPQTITLFANDDAPMSIGLLFDARGA